MYAYGFADCVDNSKYMQGYIKKCNSEECVSRKEMRLEMQAVKPSR